MTGLELEISVLGRRYERYVFAGLWTRGIEMKSGGIGRQHLLQVHWSSPMRKDLYALLGRSTGYGEVAVPLDASVRKRKPYGKWDRTILQLCANDNRVLAIGRDLPPVCAVSDDHHIACPLRPHERRRHELSQCRMALR